MKIVAPRIRISVHSFLSLSSMMLTMFALMVAVARAEPVAQVICRDIPDPGQYTLAANCSINITITASNVLLDLNGATISGSQTISGGVCDSVPGGSGNGITVTGSNVHITGPGTVKGFHTGINVGGNNNHLERLTVVGNCHGVVVPKNSHRNHVINNDISSNLEGVRLEESTSNEVTLNRIADNSGGVLILAGAGNTIIFNHILGSGHTGVLLTSQTVPNPPGASQNSIRNNTIADSIREGIRIQVGDQNTIEKNIVVGNAADVGLNQAGINLDAEHARKNFVLENLAQQNGGGDLRDENGRGCDQNIWRNNVTTMGQVPGCPHGD